MMITRRPASCFPGAKPHKKHITRIFSFVLTTEARVRSRYQSHFRDKETEAQRISAAWPGFSPIGNWVHDGNLVVQAGPSASHICWTLMNTKRSSHYCLTDISPLCHHVTQPQGTFLPSGLVFARISTLEANG